MLWFSLFQQFSFGALLDTRLSGIQMERWKLTRYSFQVIREDNNIILNYKSWLTTSPNMVQLQVLCSMSYPLTDILTSWDLHCVRKLKLIIFFFSFNQTIPSKQYHFRNQSILSHLLFALSCYVYACILAYSYGSGIRKLSGIYIEKETSFQLMANIRFF